MRGKPGLLLTLLAAAALAPALRAQVETQADPVLEPFAFHDIASGVVLADGPAERVALEVRRLDFEEWPGLLLAATIRNTSGERVALARLDLLDRVFLRPEAAAWSLRVLCRDARSAGRCRVLPLSDRRASGAWIAAARGNRGAALVAGFLAPLPGAKPGLALEPSPSGLARLSAWLEFEGLVLEPGETLETPPLAAFFAADGLVGLEWLFDEMEGRSGAEPAAGALPEGGLEELEAALQPVVDAGAPAINGFGRPLDLFAGDGLPSVWRRFAPAAEQLVLFNWTHEPELRGALFSELGLRNDAAYRVAEVSGQEIGVFRRGAVLPLAPRSLLRLVLAAQEEAPRAAGRFELLVIESPGPGHAAEARSVETNAPDLGEQLQRALRAGGAVILNHRERSPLELLPPAADLLLAPRIVPCRARAARSPRDAPEERFLERAANVEWLLDFPHQDVRADTWLVCPEAGFLATPLQGVLADDFLAARGFCVLVENGLALVTLDLSAAELERVAKILADDETRGDVLRATGAAQHAVRAAQAPAGLLKELKLERFREADLAPADPYLMQRWSAFVPQSERSIRALRASSGELVREEVVNLGDRLPFAIDVPPRFEDKVAIVVRRAPAPAPESYTLLIDNTPIGPPLAPRGEKLDCWQEDVWWLLPEQIAGRHRIGLSIVPEGGVLALARVSFLRYVEKPGTPLHSLAPSALRHEGKAPRFHRSLDGNVLRVGGEAFLFGIGCASGTTLEYELDGRFESFLARVGIDAEAGAAGSAALRVVVDGEERLVTDTLLPGERAAPITVPVQGGRLLVIEVLDAGDGAAGVHVDIVDARFVE